MHFAVSGTSTRPLVKFSVRSVLCLILTPLTKGWRFQKGKTGRTGRSVCVCICMMGKEEQILNFHDKTKNTNSEIKKAERTGCSRIVSAPKSARCFERGRLAAEKTHAIQKDEKNEKQREVKTKNVSENGVVRDCDLDRKVLHIPRST